MAFLTDYDVILQLVSLIVLSLSDFHDESYCCYSYSRIIQQYNIQLLFLIHATCSTPHVMQCDVVQLSILQCSQAMQCNMYSRFFDAK